MATQGFWPLTSSVDWCEDNYTHSHYIAEFWNSISSIAMIVFGEFGARVNSCQSFRFRLAFRLVSVVGIGSLLFHGTLTSQMQALDEVPMVWSALTLLHSLIESIFGNKGSWLPILLMFYGLLITASITISTGALQVKFFHLSFGSIELLCVFLMYRIYSKKKNSHPSIKYLFERGVMTYTTAIIVWLTDLNLCKYLNGKENSVLPFNPQLHAIWHILASMGSYILVVLVLYNWLYENGQKCKIEWWYCGLIPVCRTLDVEVINKDKKKNVIKDAKLSLGKKSGNRRLNRRSKIKLSTA